MQYQCERCGLLFSTPERQAFCPKCCDILEDKERLRRYREQQHIIRHNEQPQLEGYHKRKAHKQRAELSQKSIAEINKLARAAGMSYGQYVAKIKNGGQ